MQQLKSGSSLQGGKYKIEKVLGQGGFGITYLATQELLNRKVAIKEFFYKEYCERDEATSHVTLGTTSNRELVERFMEKFIKEARTISTLNHPHIIRIYDIFKENNTAYYVMEYIEGTSLAEMVKRQGALPEDVAIDYIKQTASALEFVHRHSINHLDVKPANIMVRKEDNQAVLIDFGLSKQYDASGEQTSTTPVGISHGYAPMEQYNVGGVGTFSPQTDIYSLGATLYKLVTGNTPPQAGEVLNEGLPELPSFVSSSVADVIKKAMQPRKTDRQNSVDEFISVINISSLNTSSTEKEVKPQQNQTVDEETKVLNNAKFKSKEGKDSIDDIISEENKNKDKQIIQNKIGRSLLLVLGCVIVFLMLKNSANSNSSINHDTTTTQKSQPSTNNNGFNDNSSNSNESSDLYLDDYSLVKIGDFYYEDGTFSHKLLNFKKCVGIVFDLKTSEFEKQNGWTHGWIVALSDANHGEYSKWGVLENLSTPFDDIKYNREENSAACIDWKGYEYLQKIKSTHDLENFPAFDIACKYPVKLPIGKTSGWYLPSLGQLHSILVSFMSSGNIKLNGDIYFTEESDYLKYLNLKDAYWSSTEEGYSNSWYYHISEKSAFCATNAKNSRQIKIRCVAAF